MAVVSVGESLHAAVAATVRWRLNLLNLPQQRVWRPWQQQKTRGDDTPQPVSPVTCPLHQHSANTTSRVQPTKLGSSQRGRGVEYPMILSWGGPSSAEELRPLWQPPQVCDAGLSVGSENERVSTKTLSKSHGVLHISKKVIKGK